MLNQIVKMLCLASVTVFVGQTVFAVDGGMQDEKPTVRSSEKFGLNFYYAGEQGVQEFLSATPSVAGVWWKFHKEDETHWYGELHYPTENTGDYEAADPRQRAPQYYMVFNLAIRKQKGLPIDLKTYRGSLVLCDPQPDVPLSTQGDGTSYELIGYQPEKTEKHKHGFLFKRHAELKYRPPNQ